MLDREILLKCSSPWLLKTTDSIAADIMNASYIMDSAGMRNLDELYSSLASVLRFPEYFSNNFNSLSEMMADLAWIKSNYYILIFLNAELLLDKESSDVFDGFLNLLNDIGEEWSLPIELGEPWDRPSVPFHGIFSYNKNNEDIFLDRIKNIRVPISDISI